ncbi:helix-turn-helix domain-containing protein [Streptomyces lanatus]
MLSKHAWITGRPRRRLGDAIGRAYVQGVPIRTLADISGRSFGSVRQLLIEADVVLSPRGGRTGRAGQSPQQIVAARHFERELANLCQESWELGILCQESNDVFRGSAGRPSRPGRR